MGNDNRTNATYSEKLQKKKHNVMKHILQVGYKTRHGTDSAGVKNTLFRGVRVVRGGSEIKAPTKANSFNNKKRIRSEERR